MSTDGRDYEKELERIVGGAAESVLEASDDEIREEVRAAGTDPDQAAERVREVLLDAVTAHRKERLARARRAYEARREEIESRDYELPGTPKERLSLLTAVLRTRPWATEMLTVQHRELRDLPDEDVVSYLRQLAALGVLDEES